MGKPKILELTEAQRLELERGFRLGDKHCFRMRCRAVLLKAAGLSAGKACAHSSDEESVRRAIEQDRQCVSKAKAAWEEATGKEASDATFKRFLSALAQDISV